MHNRALLRKAPDRVGHNIQKWYVFDLSEVTDWSGDWPAGLPIEIWNLSRTFSQNCAISFICNCCGANGCCAGGFGAGHCGTSRCNKVAVVRTDMLLANVVQFDV